MSALAIRDVTCFDQIVAFFAYGWYFEGSELSSRIEAMVQGCNIDEYNYLCEDEPIITINSVAHDRYHAAWLLQQLDRSRL